MKETEETKKRLADLRSRLEELEDSIPAHSTSIHHIARIEELEEEIEELEALLGWLTSSNR